MILRRFISNQILHLVSSSFNDSSFNNKLHRELQTDFVQLRQKAKNIPPLTNPIAQEIFYWSEGIKTPEEALKISKAILQQGKTIVPSDNRYIQFEVILCKYILAYSKITDILLISQMGVRVGTQNQQLWTKIQKRFLKQYHKLTLQQRIKMFSNIAFSNCSSEYFYVKAQEIFIPIIPGLKIKQALDIAFSFYYLQRGGQSFIKSLIKIIEANLIQITQQYSIRTIKILSNAKNAGFIIKNFQKVIIQQKYYNQYSFQQTCQLVKHLGYDLGSNQFINILQNRIINLFLKDGNFHFEKLSQGFLNYYRLKIGNFNKFLPKIQEQIEFSSPIYLCYLAKYLHVIQLDLHRVAKRVQKLIRQHLWHKQLDIKQLGQIVHSFCLIRTAQRQFYKDLQEVVMKKFSQIISNRSILERIVNAYIKSNLCSPDTLRSLKLVL